VNCGVEGTCDDQRAQLRDRGRERPIARDLRGGVQVRRFEGAEEIDRMAPFVAAGGQLAKRGRQRLHRAESLVLRRRRKRPRIAERHGAESPGLLASAGAHAAPNVEQRHTINGSSAELIRRAIAKFLERMRDVDDADVGRARGLDGGCARLQPRSERRRRGDAEKPPPGDADHDRIIDARVVTTTSIAECRVSIAECGPSLKIADLRLKCRLRIDMPMRIEVPTAD
jgi:hypothetical protein